MGNVNRTKSKPRTLKSFSNGVRNDEMSAFDFSIEPAISILYVSMHTNYVLLPCLTVRRRRNTHMLATYKIHSIFSVPTIHL